VSVSPRGGSCTSLFWNRGNEVGPDAHRFSEPLHCEGSRVLQQRSTQDQTESWGSTAVEVRPSPGAHRQVMKVTWRASLEADEPGKNSLYVLQLLSLPQWSGKTCVCVCVCVCVCLLCTGPVSSFCLRGLERQIGCCLINQGLFSVMCALGCVNCCAFLRYSYTLTHTQTHTWASSHALVTSRQLWSYSPLVLQSPLDCRRPGNTTRLTIWLTGLLNIHQYV